MHVAIPSMPNDKFPVIVRVATRSEVAGIPTDRYFVKVLESPASSQNNVTDEPNGEESVIVAIGITKELQKTLIKIRRNYRAEVRQGGGGGGGSQISNLFKEPIKESRMADCILNIMETFFHGDETCSIYNTKYNRMEFCVLLHLYFKYIHILKNDSRLSYSTFLQKKVYVKKSEFGERTYNTYANKDVFQKFEKELENIQVNFNLHPKYPPESNENILKPAFQEIGWAFHHSPYFKELRDLRKALETFDL